MRLNANGNHKAKMRFNGGFTLVEILVALAVLGILIPPVLGLFTVASISNHRSIRNTVALTVARDIMDRIKTGDINSINQDRRIEDYEERYGVKVFVSGIMEGSNNSLGLVKVYVAPRPGVDPRTEGIMLGSYMTNIYTGEMDKRQSHIPGFDKDNGDVADPGRDGG